MTDRYEKIRKALEMGPTPGPWEQDGDGVSAVNEDVAVAMCCPSDAEAAFISACDPGTIWALLAERDQLAAALEAAREDGWQPIETAPDEAWFLVHSDRGWIGLARRSDPDYAPDEGWFEDEHTEFLEPAWLTHWRPLPAPPAIDQALKEGGAAMTDRRSSRATTHAARGTDHEQD